MSRRREHRQPVSFDVVRAEPPPLPWNQGTMPFVGDVGELWGVRLSGITHDGRGGWRFTVDGEFRTRTAGLSREEATTEAAALWVARHRHLYPDVDVQTPGLDLEGPIARPRAWKTNLDLINARRRQIGMAPLDPGAAGWTDEDLAIEAGRLRGNPVRAHLLSWAL